MLQRSPVSPSANHFESSTEGSSRAGLGGWLQQVQLTGRLGEIEMLKLTMLSKQTPSSAHPLACRPQEFCKRWSIHFCKSSYTEDSPVVSPPTLRVVLAADLLDGYALATCGYAINLWLSGLKYQVYSRGKHLLSVIYGSRSGKAYPTLFLFFPKF